MRPQRISVAVAVALLGMTSACQRAAAANAGSRSHGSGGAVAARNGPAPRSGGAGTTPSVTPRGGASAADAPPAEYYPAAVLARVAAGLARSGATGRTLRKHPSYSYIQGRRHVSGGPELHDHWADVAVVQAGHATALTGGHLVGATTVSPGEHRGGHIVGGTARAISTGDLLVIPAGVPHQYQLAPGDSLRYLTIKVAEDAPRH